MRAQIKGPGAGTHRANSYHSRFNQRLIVKTWQSVARNRDQLDAAKSAKLYVARMGQKRRTRA